MPKKKKKDPRFEELFYPVETEFKLTSYYSAKPDPDYIIKRIGGRGALRLMYNKDPEIAQATDTRYNAAEAVPWRIEGENEKMVEAVTDFIKPHERKLRKCFWWAVPYGYAVTQLVWDFEGGVYKLDCVIDEPFEKFKPTEEGRVFLNNSAFMSKGSEPELSAKFMLTARQATNRNPYGEALYSRLYWNHFYRCNLDDFWMQFAERFSLPFLYGKTPFQEFEQGGNSVQNMQRALDKARKAASLAVDTESEIGMLYQNGNGDFFEKFMNHLDKQVQRLVLGQTLTSDSAKNAGSLAQAKVHNQVREDKKRADLKLLEESFNKLIDHYFDLNQLPEDMKPKYVLQDDIGLEIDRAQRDKILIDSGQIKFTEKYILERYDLEEGDFEIVEAQNAFSPQMTKFNKDIRSVKSIEKLPKKDSEQVRDDLGLYSAALKKSKNKKELIENLDVLLEQDDTFLDDLLTKALYSGAVSGYLDGEDT